MGKGIHLPKRLEGLWERREVPHWGSERSVGVKRIWCVLSIAKHFCMQSIVNQ